MFLTKTISILKTKVLSKYLQMNDMVKAADVPVLIVTNNNLEAQQRSKGGKHLSKPNLCCNIVNKFTTKQTFYRVNNLLEMTSQNKLTSK